jgi:hypothetical protein
MFDPWTPLEKAGKLPEPPGRAETLEAIRLNPYVKPEVRLKEKAEAQKQARKDAKKREIPLGSGLNTRRPTSTRFSNRVSQSRRGRFPSLKHGAD